MADSGLSILLSFLCISDLGLELEDDIIVEILIAGSNRISLVVCFLIFIILLIIFANL